MDQATNGTAEDLGAILGLTAASRLMAVYGGDILYIPSTAEPGHKVARLIGVAAWRRLVNDYSGDTIRIPHNAEADRLALIRAVARMILDGRRINDIASAIDMSPRQVMRYRVEAEQMGLLDMVIKDRV